MKAGKNNEKERKIDKEEKNDNKQIDKQQKQSIFSTKNKNTFKKRICSIKK